MNAAQVLSGPELEYTTTGFSGSRPSVPNRIRAASGGIQRVGMGPSWIRKSPSCQVHGPGDMVLDILVDIGLAVEDHQVPVAKVAGQPFSGNPLYRRIAFSIRIDHGHFSHRKHGSVSTPWIRIYPLLNRR